LVTARQFLLALVFGFATSGCASTGPLEGGRGAVLSGDVASMSAEDLARPGPHEVEGERRTFKYPAGDFDFVMYRPAGIAAPAPAVVFLPGRFAPEEQYESYARLLATRGYVVAMRARYGWFHPDARLADEAVALEHWLSSLPYVDAKRIGIAGHSMGGRVAVTAAVNDENFRAVVSIDPGGERSVPVIDHVVEKLRAPLLLIGAEVAWKGWDICAPLATNYQRFFERAPAGTVELTILGADHVQLMDEPDAFGQFICRVGTADSRVVRNYARRATLQFFDERMGGAPHPPFENDRNATVRVRALPTAINGQQRPDG
jgi:dienelactone hydrolase